MPGPRPRVFRKTSFLANRERIAKSDAHNLHEHLAKHEESVLRFMAEPVVSFTNNAGEPKFRMAKVKMKVSGCFRTQHFAEAWCRISSYLSSMEALGYNPLAGNAADMLKSHSGQTEPEMV